MILACIVVSPLAEFFNNAVVHAYYFANATGGGPINVGVILLYQTAALAGKLRGRFLGGAVKIGFLKKLIHLSLGKASEGFPETIPCFLTNQVCAHAGWIAFQ